jgi:hypothetical protein
VGEETFAEMGEASILIRVVASIANREGGSTRHLERMRTQVRQANIKVEEEEKSVVGATDICKNLNFTSRINRKQSMQREKC